MQGQTSCESHLSLVGVGPSLEVDGAISIGGHESCVSLHRPLLSHPHYVSYQHAHCIMLRCRPPTAAPGNTNISPINSLSLSLYKIAKSNSIQRIKRSSIGNKYCILEIQSLLKTQFYSKHTSASGIDLRVCSRMKLSLYEIGVLPSDNRGYSHNHISLVPNS